MNKKIQKLAEQCYEKHELLGTYEFNKEKFARLIIEEANDVVYSLLEENTGAEVVVRVKEHFGVE